MSIVKSKNHVFDYAVIGSGLSGLTVATALSQKTANVILLDGADHFGGSNRPIQFATGVINNGLRIVPESLPARQALQFLESISGYKIGGETISAPAITFENGDLRSFLGFNDDPPAFYEELAYFICNQRIDLKIEPYLWPQLLMDRFKGTFAPKSYVTRFNIDQERVQTVLINGSKLVAAENFIYCGSLRDLALLVPEETLGARAKLKLSKNKYWTAVGLDLCHSHFVTDKENIHILNGTTQDDLGPSAGIFLPAVEVDGRNLQASQWVTFMDFESTEESELLATALKKVKRQINRAYPNATDELQTERIFISPIIGGNGDLKLAANQTLPKASNLWIGSPNVNPQKNLIGSLQQSHLILSSLGFSLEDVQYRETETSL